MCKFGVGFMKSIANQHDEDLIQSGASKPDRANRPVVQNACHDIVGFGDVVQVQFDAALAAIGSRRDSFDGCGKFLAS